MKNIAVLSAVLIVVIALMIGFAASSRSDIAQGDLSCALSVIANQSKMAKYGIKGNAILFSADDFERSLNVSEIESITLTEVPAITEGSLCLGDKLVSAGQIISRSNIDLLNYRGAGKDFESSFRFKVDGYEYEMTCELYLLDRANSAPTVDMEDDASLAVSTHVGIAIGGRIRAYDAEGDDMRFEIVSYPKNGTIDLNAETGEYTYTPLGSYFGEDSFSYVAIDTYGNYSSAKQVVLDVQRLSVDVVYSDMEGHPAHHAALALTEKSVMSGATIGESTYFMPDVSVSRIDFLVMTMNAAGIDDVKSVKDTGFDDDDEIPEEMKGYVRRARELGIIGGSIDADGRLCFEPNRAITRAEAALIVNNIVRGQVPIVKPTFADKSEIPTWASDAIYSLNHLGILSAENGNISPSSEITRAQTAQMLYSLMCVLEKK